MMTFEVIKSTVADRDLIRNLLSDYSGESIRIDKDTWNFCIEEVGTDALTDLFDELGLDYRLV